MTNPTGPRKLVRTRDGRLVAGVCSGLGAYFRLDPQLVRVVFALLTIFSAAFPGVLVYLVAWIVIPAEDEPESIAERFIKQNS